MSNDHRAPFDNNYIYAAIIGDNVDVLEILLCTPGMYADNITYRTAIQMKAEKCCDYLIYHPTVTQTMW